MLSSHPKHPPQEAGFGQVCKPGAVEVETGITEFAVTSPAPGSVRDSRKKAESDS